MALRKFSSNRSSHNVGSCGPGGNGGDTQSILTNSSTAASVPDRLKTLYPLVNEAETPLPRSWSPKDKFNFIGLSQSNLRVHYKGK